MLVFLRMCIFCCTFARFFAYMRACVRSQVCNSHEKKAKLMFNFLTYGYYRIGQK